MSKLDFAVRWAVTLGIVVPVFSFCWCAGAVKIARERFDRRDTVSA